MKKSVGFFILFIISCFLWAQDYSEERTWGEEDEPQKTLFHMKNRMVELSLANTSINLSNNAIALNDIFLMPFEAISSREIFQRSMVIDIDKIGKGLNLYSIIEVKPLSLNFNWKDNWGFGLDIAHINAMGNLTFPGKILSQKETEGDTFGVAAAVFADVGIPVFFHYNDIKIKFRPAAYVPLVYAKPGITYSYEEGGKLQIGYDMRIYSLVDAQERDYADDAWSIASNNLGYDFGLGAEYSMSSELDIGFDMINIPIPFMVAKLNYYSQLEGEAFLDTGKLQIADIREGDGFTQGPDGLYDYPDEISFTYGYDSEGKKIYRPFKTLIYARYRSYDLQMLSFIPMLGFSLNFIYKQIFSMEGGLTIRYDPSNIFISSIGIHYTDRVWKNNIDFALNLRAFQFDFGISLQSPDFLKLYQGTGLGFTTGIKLGW